MTKRKTVTITHRVRITDRPEAGCATMHPKDGLIFITDGSEYIDGRVSNHFYWRKINADGTLGDRDRCGYGNW